MRFARQLDALEHADEPARSSRPTTHGREDEYLDARARALEKRREAAQDVRARASASCSASWRWAAPASRSGSSRARPKPRGPKRHRPRGVYLSAKRRRGAATAGAHRVGRRALARHAGAFATLAAARAPGKTLIFDEVDAGIGGRVADVVGRKLRGSATTSRCCASRTCRRSPLPATRTSGFRRSVVDGRTHTRVARLDAEQRVEELARMIGGAAPTASVAGSRGARRCSGESETKPKGESESREVESAETSAKAR